MTVNELVANLAQHDGNTELDNLVTSNKLGGDFWKSLVCTGLKVLQGSGVVKLDGEQSAVFNVILSQICGG